MAAISFVIASWKELKIAQNAQINQLFQLVHTVTPMRSAKIRLRIVWVVCMALLLRQRPRLMGTSKDWLYAHDALGVRLYPTISFTIVNMRDLHHSYRANRIFREDRSRRLDSDQSKNPTAWRVGEYIKGTASTQVNIFINSSQKTCVHLCLLL